MTLNMCKQFQCLITIESLISVFNFIFLTVGCAIISLGVYVQTQLSEYFDFLDMYKLTHDVKLQSMILIVFGVLVISYSILAFVSSCEQRRVAFGILVSFMAIILLAEVTMATVLFIHKGDSCKAIDYGLTQSIQNYGNVSAVTLGWDKIQENLKCCGTNGPSSWEKYNITVPDSCNNTMVSQDEKETEFANDVWPNGCLETVNGSLVFNGLIVCVVGTSIVVIQLIDVISAFCLMVKIESKRSLRKRRLRKMSESEMKAYEGEQIINRRYNDPNLQKWETRV